VHVAPAQTSAGKLPTSPGTSKLKIAAGIAPRARRRPLARRKPYGRKLGFAVFTALSGALAFSLLTDGGRNARTAMPLLPSADEMLYFTGLRIEQVALTGQRHTSDSDVFDALDLNETGSLVSFDSAAARERIERIPWVATASINRVYPGALKIHITERKPAALWIKGDREYLIDVTGRVLSAVQPGSNTQLPRIAGEGAAAEARALFDLILRYPHIKERFELAERVGGRRWTLRLRDGITIHFGADHEANAFAALSSDTELGPLLSGRDIIIDLRTPGRITVRRDDEAAKAAALSPTNSQSRS